MVRFFAGLAALVLLSACAGDTTGDATPAEVAAAAYKADGPPSITIFTMVNNRNGNGGHTAMMVNGSQQVIFDPAGSFRDPRLVERGDVIYGISPKWIDAYKSAHARATFHVVSQTIPVTAAQAEQALRLVQANGSVPGAYCAKATTALLQQVDGFGQIENTFYPISFMEQVESLPGVVTTRYYENDEGDVIDAVRAAQLAQ